MKNIDVMKYIILTEGWSKDIDTEKTKLKLKELAEKAKEQERKRIRIKIKHLLDDIPLGAYGCGYEEALLKVENILNDD